MGRLRTDIPDRYCEVCGVLIPRGTKKNEKRVNPSQYIKARFCSLRCKGIWWSAEKTGITIKEINPDRHKCMDCGGFVTNLSAKRCRRCFSKYYSGENNHSWKGGITNEYNRLRSSASAKQWRKQVFKRDNYTCQLCGDNKGGNLNAHHIHPWKDFPLLRYVIENGITLCKPCHILIHKKH